MKFLVPLLLALAGTMAAADTPSLAGNWKVHSNIAGYESDLNCTFTQTGDEIGGTCKNEEANLTVTGKVSESKVTLQYKTEYNGEQLTLVYTGKMESSTKFSGVVAVLPMDVDGDFTATLVK